MLLSGKESMMLQRLQEKQDHHVTSCYAPEKSRNIT